MFKVVYSAATGRIRRIIKPPKGRDIRERLGAGEAILDLDDTRFVDVVALQASLNARTGKAPTGDRYAVMQGVAPDATQRPIIGIILADPACGDAIPGCTLIQSDTAQVGWTFASGTGFTPIAVPVGRA